MYVGFGFVGLGVGVVVCWVCVCSCMVRSFMVAEMDRSSSVILLMVINSSSILVDSWLSFSLSLFMCFPKL